MTLKNVLAQLTMFKEGHGVHANSRAEDEAALDNINRSISTVEKIETVLVQMVSLLDILIENGAAEPNDLADEVRLLDEIKMLLKA